MYLRTLPSFVTLATWSLQISGHTVGMVADPGLGRVRNGRGARWVGSMTIPALTRSDALQLRAFIHSLRGRAGSFYLQHPAAIEVTVPTIDNTWADGTTFADGTFFNDQEGITQVNTELSEGDTVADLDLYASSLTPGQTLWIGPQDGYGQLVRIVSIDGDNVTFRPPARRTYPVTTPVKVDRPFGLFRLAQDPPPVPLVNGVSQPITINFEEYR